MKHWKNLSKGLANMEWQNVGGRFFCRSSWCFASGSPPKPPPSLPLAKDTHILAIPQCNCSSSQKQIITDNFDLLATSSRIGAKRSKNLKMKPKD